MSATAAQRALPSVVAAVMLTSSPLLLVSAGFWVMALVLNEPQNAWLHGLAAAVTLFLVVGVAGSYLVHELGHLAVMALAPGVSSVTVESTLTRLSIAPHGTLSPRDALIGALAGPGACVVTGIIMLAVGSPPAVAWCYLVHGGFVLPLFGDGRTALVALRQLRGCSRRRATARVRHR